MRRQAPSPLRQLVPEADRIRLDEAYNNASTQYVIGIIIEYLKNKVKDIELKTEAENKYEQAAWPYLQADAVGSKRALRNLQILLANTDKREKE